MTPPTRSGPHMARRSCVLQVIGGESDNLFFCAGFISCWDVSFRSIEV